METIEKMAAERYTKMQVGNTIDFSNDERFTENLYLSRFEVMPNQMTVNDIDIKKAYEYFFKTYRAEIKECYYEKSIDSKGKIDFDEICLFLFEDLFVCFRSRHYRNSVRFLYRKTDGASVEKMAKELWKFKHKKREKPEIQLLVKGYEGLETRTMTISKPKLTIDDNYNDDFLPIHKIILSRLQKKNDKGLVLLHGKPGTGKTSYIRYLITSLKKDVIFLPPNMAASITDPGLMSLMIENPDSVFVIEDAENIIIDRDRSGLSPVSALLNLADGLLSDCLNIQIICSFNTDLSRVDSALTRKGRLIAKYEFKELETHKAQALSNKLGFDTQITKPMSLAAVYNQNDAEFSTATSRKAIGF